jgi:hypothetical protein
MIVREARREKEYEEHGWLLKEITVSYLSYYTMLMLLGSANDVIVSLLTI